MSGSRRARIGNRQRSSPVNIQKCAHAGLLEDFAQRLQVRSNERDVLRLVVEANSFYQCWSKTGNAFARRVRVFSRQQGTLGQICEVVPFSLKLEKRCDVRLAAVRFPALLCRLG